MPGQGRKLATGTIGFAICATMMMTTLSRVRAETKAETKAESRDVQQEYLQLVKKALREHELEHFSEAKSFFEAAHKLQPSARTLRGLALSSYELRSYVDAISYMEQALASDIKPLNRAMREHLEGLLQEAKLFVTKVHVALTPDSAVLHVDGRPASFTDERLILLDPGRHEFVASAEGHEPITRTIQTGGGEKLILDFTLRPIQVTNPVVAGDQVPGPRPTSPWPAQRPDDHAEDSLTPWLLIGGGAGLAIVGGVLMAIALSDVDKIEGADDGSEWNHGFGSAYDRSPIMSGVGITMLLTGATGALVGTIMKLPLSPEQPEAGAWLEVTPVSARLRGHF